MATSGLPGSDLELCEGTLWLYRVVEFSGRMEWSKSVIKFGDGIE